jgi:tyrosyl-tRNA synthetase
MDFVETLKGRGMLAQITHPEELHAHLAEGPRTAYIGFDPTASSLHVGSLMPIMALRRWQQAGHRVIAVVGGGTALVGDPSGKSDMRQMLTREQIDTNMAGIKQQLERFVDMSDPSRGIILNNAEWLVPLHYLEFLREIGPHFSVNRMLTAECFRQRLEKGLSFLEFNYMLLQSYDFLHLYREQACTIQMGGDDQWSNILGGMELVRRLVPNGKSFCITFPLLTTSDGKKMGKTEKGAVWLDADRTSPYEYFQFWRNVEDAKIRDCLAYFTELPMTEVDRLGQLAGAAINEAKVVLAYEATRLLHGEKEASLAREAAAQLFAGASGHGNEPEVVIDRKVLGDGLEVLEFLVITGIAPSKSEARRLVAQGGLVINGQKVEDMSYRVTPNDFLGAEGCLIRKGKKHHYRSRISD